MSQCLTCGSRVADDERVCQECGMELKPPPPAPPAELPQPSPVVGPAPAAARVTLKRGGISTEHTFAFAARALLGRFDPETGPVDVDLSPLPEAIYVSRRHAEIRYVGRGQWVIRSLAAKNGTFVRAGSLGEFLPVQGEQALQDGDEIALGNATFEFRTG
jgi:hypothetical protein